MAFKRALVVDDSRSARVAMKVMLEEHGLGVEFAESGEEGLEFLKKNMVDVIFMDHTMPGMDGLEAVAQIKANPRTATIPVMMYTTKEGEVYVSQARALGAVGVLPKEVQPGVLFNMLLELGLVTDRRADAGPDARPDARKETASAAASSREEEPEVYEIPSQGTVSSVIPDADADPELDQQVLGMSLQAVVTRILEDQHMSLRSDILFSHREFARQVADEIFTRQQREAREGAQLPPTQPTPPADGRRSSQPAMMLLALVLLVPAMVLGMLYVQTANERDLAQAELRAMDTEVSEQLSVAEQVTTDLIKDMNAERRETLSSHLTTLQWALNQGAGVPYQEQAFNAARAQSLERLLSHLRDLRFEGTVRLTSHLGEFCLIPSVSGFPTPAPAGTSVSECTMIGHPLDDSSFQLDRLTPEFADFLNSSPLTNNSGINVDLVARDRFNSTRKYPFAASIATAGEWNEIAQRNNRVEIELVPD